MTYIDLTNPLGPLPWNGPICPSCGRGYIQTGTITTIPYVPKHRKPGPAQ